MSWRCGRPGSDSSPGSFCMALGLHAPHTCHTGGGNAWAALGRRRRATRALSLRTGPAPGLIFTPGPESALLWGGAPTGGGEGACPAPDLPTAYQLDRASPRQRCIRPDRTLCCLLLPP